MQDYLMFTVDEAIKLISLGIYVEDLRALVVADLHLGYEEALSQQGIYVPPIQLSSIKQVLSDMLRQTDASRLILLGDVKHEFGSALRQEWKEVLELFSWLKERGLRVDVVRGNHDNFLIPILKRLEIPLHDPFLKEGKYFFVHGHKPLPVEAYGEDVKYIFMGHEHPAVIFRDELGIKIKFKCFLEGKIDGKTLFVLPALSPLMAGTEVNVEDTGRLSPILKSLDLDSFRVYVVDLEAGIYDFGELRLLKTLIYE